jgi:Raf kinase inhibitor-like YbhB/YbcL family protein
VSRGSVCAALAIAAAFAAGCETTPLDQPLPEADAGMELRGADFEDGGELPEEQTCDGAGKSPGLEWSGVPEGTAELALLMIDLDGQEGRLVHWSVFAIPPEADHLEAGVTPAAVELGTTSFGRLSYEPVCPPAEDGPHRYLFVLYALSDDLDLAEGASASELVNAIARVAKARGSVEAEVDR